MGFFKSEDLKTDSITTKGKPATCASCGLHKGCTTPKMKPYGSNKKKIMLIAGCPSKEDDVKGKPWRSKNGRQFQNFLKDLGVDLFEDTVTINTCNCYTKEITPQSIMCCRPKINLAIQQYKPKVIIMLGNYPIQSIIGKKWKKSLGGVSKWRGWNIPDREYNAYICPVYHPDFVFNEKDADKASLIQRIWKEDLLKAIGCHTKRRPNLVFTDDTKGIEYITTDHAFKRAMARLLKCKFMAFDIETTGLKPHHPDQKIICTAVAYTGMDVVVWMNTPERDKAFKKILRNTKIKKSAHNLTFEDMWCVEKIGIVRGWIWCSMNTAHILDNRKGITGLKFQVYVNFGVCGYDEHIESFLKSDSKKYGGNGINKIEEFIAAKGEKEVMKYCGLDALYGYKLTTIQMQEIEDAEDIPY